MCGGGKTTSFLLLIKLRLCAISIAVTSLPLPPPTQRQSFSIQLLAVLELALTRTALNSGGCLFIQSAGIKSMGYHYHHHHWLIFLISKEYYKHQVSLWHFQIS